LGFGKRADGSGGKTLCATPSLLIPPHVLHDRIAVLHFLVGVFVRICAQRAFARTHVRMRAQKY
jgi:hypothetical protein